MLTDEEFVYKQIGMTTDWLIRAINQQVSRLDLRYTVDTNIDKIIPLHTDAFTGSHIDR